MKKRWPVVLLLVAVVAGSMALTRAPGRAVTGSTQPATEVAGASETATLVSLTRRLAAETDRITVGMAQMRLNASVADPSPR